MGGYTNKEFSFSLRDVFAMIWPKTMRYPNTKHFISALWITRKPFRFPRRSYENTKQTVKHPCFLPWHYINIRKTPFVFPHSVFCSITISRCPKVSNRTQNSSPELKKNTIGSTRVCQLIRIVEPFFFLVSTWITRTTSHNLTTLHSCFMCL